MTTMRLTPLLLIAVLATALVAQTTNVVNFNQLTLNGVGAGGTSIIPLATAVGAGVTQVWSGLPNSPIIMAVAAFALPNAAVIGPNNTLDLDPLTFAFFLDGTGAFIPSPLAVYLRTNGAGAMTFIVPNAPLTAGLNYGVQGAFLNPAYATGLQTTAAFNVVGVVDPNPNLGVGNPVANPAAASAGSGDDSSFITNLGWGFTFYGVTYTQLWCGTNGYVTSASFTSLGESAAALVTAPAKICACWDDLNVTGAATMMFYTDGVGLAEYTWTNVPEYSATGSNTFKITITNTSVVLDYGGLTLLDGLAGLSPGLITPAAVALPLNLTWGNQIPLFNQGATVEAPYQLFPGTGGANNNDLAGRQITFLLNATGVPVAIQ